MKYSTQIDHWQSHGGIWDRGAITGVFFWESWGKYGNVDSRKIRVVVGHS